MYDILYEPWTADSNKNYRYLPQLISLQRSLNNDDVMALERFPNYKSFVKGVQHGPMDSSDKGPVMRSFNL